MSSLDRLFKASVSSDICKYFFVMQVEGNTVRIHKQPGWLFGDVALLFLSQRSASVIATSDITLWALNRRAFSKVRACVASRHSLYICK